MLARKLALGLPVVLALFVLVLWLLPGGSTRAPAESSEATPELARPVASQSAADPERPSATIELLELLTPLPTRRSAPRTSPAGARALHEVSGLATDEQGEPAAAVQLLISPPEGSGRLVKTDGAGRFRADLPQSGPIRVEPLGTSSKWRLVGEARSIEASAPCNDLVVEVVQVGQATLEIQAVDAKGRALDPFGIRVAARNGRESRVQNRTSIDGLVRIEVPVLNPGTIAEISLVDPVYYDNALDRALHLIGKAKPVQIETELAVRSGLTYPVVLQAP